MLKIYKASLKTLKQVTNENIAQYSELRLFYQLVHQFNASILNYFINIWKVQIISQVLLSAVDFYRLYFCVVSG